jgi:hypothetical protein
MMADVDRAAQRGTVFFAKCLRSGLGASGAVGG